MPFPELPTPLRAALDARGYAEPTPVQSAVLAPETAGRDLLVSAQTGSGKTLAFGIPVLQRTVAPHDPDHADLAAPDKPQALIVAPTRELALQVSRDLSLAGADRGTRVLTVYGGVGYDTQLDTLKAGVDVVVGSEPVTVARRSVERSWRGVMTASSLTKRKKVSPSWTIVASIMPRPVPRLTSIHGFGSLNVTKSRVVAYIMRW